MKESKSSMCQWRYNPIFQAVNTLNHAIRKGVGSICSPHVRMEILNDLD